LRATEVKAGPADRGFLEAIPLQLDVYPTERDTGE